MRPHLRGKTDQMGLDSVAILERIDGMGFPCGAAIIPIQAAENDVRPELYPSQPKKKKGKSKLDVYHL